MNLSSDTKTAPSSFPYIAFLSKYISRLFEWSHSPDLASEWLLISGTETLGMADVLQGGQTQSVVLVPKNSLEMTQMSFSNAQATALVHGGVVKIVQRYPIIAAVVFLVRTWIGFKM